MVGVAAGSDFLSIAASIFTSFVSGLVVRWRAAVAPPLMDADRLKLNHLELEEGIPFIGNAFMLPKQIHGELPVCFHPAKSP